MKNKKKKVSKEREAEKVERNNFREWLKVAVPEMAKLILVDFVKISFEFHDGKSSGTPDGAIFAIEHSREYHRATINVFPDAVEMWNNQEFSEIISCLIHELSHINTSPLAALAQARYVSRDEVREAVESLTETIANYIMRDEERMSELYHNLEHATRGINKNY